MCSPSQYLLSKLTQGTNSPYKKVLSIRYLSEHMEESSYTDTPNTVCTPSSQKKYRSLNRTGTPCQHLNLSRNNLNTKFCAYMKHTLVCRLKRRRSIPLEILLTRYCPRLLQNTTTPFRLWRFRSTPTTDHLAIKLLHFSRLHRDSDPQRIFDI